MTSKEALKKLYNERGYAYDNKICSKGKEWNEAIKHYDIIGKCLQVIERDLEKLEKYKYKSIEEEKELENDK